MRERKGEGKRKERKKRKAQINKQVKGRINKEKYLEKENYE